MSRKIHWEDWSDKRALPPISYICGFCGHKVGSAYGFYSSQNPLNLRIYICTNCGRPTFFDGFENIQSPGQRIGKDISKLPDDIAVIYNEIRSSIKEGSNTAAVLTARKLIMHLAISVAGATEGEKFVKYIEHLKSTGYIPPKSVSWLEKIKNDGNENNHQLKLSNQEEATAHLKFIELLLSFMFEYSDDIDTQSIR